MVRSTVFLATLALIGSGCSPSSEPTTAVSVTIPTTTTVTSPATTVPAEPSTTAVPEPTTTLPGEPVRGFATVGDELAVVGISHDDVLNVRAGPGISFAPIAGLDPTGTAVATGAARDLGLVVWYEVSTDGTTGWVNSRFMAFLGATDDATARVVDRLGAYPSAGSMDELGRIVAGSQASTEPPSVVVMTVGPIGDLGEVTYDVIGLGDDSVYGYRLHVFGEPVGDGFSLHTVERTALCGRGVTSGNGSCV